LNVATQYPVATSHILMVLSLEEERRWSAEGRNTTDDTLWSCPCRVFTHENVDSSHSLMLMSALHDASILPEGSQAMSCTLSVCPLSVLSYSPLS